MNEYMEKIIELSKELALQEERSRTLAARLDVANEKLQKGIATDLQAENDELRAHVAALEQSLAVRAEQYEAAAWEASEARRERNEARTELEIERKKRQELEAALKECVGEFEGLNERHERIKLRYNDLFAHSVKQAETLAHVEEIMGRLSKAAGGPVCGVVRVKKSRAYDPNRP